MRTLCSISSASFVHTNGLPVPILGNGALTLEMTQAPTIDVDVGSDFTADVKMSAYGQRMIEWRFIMAFDPNDDVSRHRLGPRWGTGAGDYVCDKHGRREDPVAMLSSTSEFHAYLCEDCHAEMLEAVYDPVKWNARQDVLKELQRTVLRGELPPCW